MNDPVNDLMESVQRESDARFQALQRLWSAADSSKVFGQPVSSGGYTVIPAAEVASGGGFGSGMGFGMPPRNKRKVLVGAGGSTPAASEESGASASPVEGGGAGGGGGGGAMGRPVAVIVVGPSGVNVKPVLDLTKLSLTALGAFGATAAIFMRMLKKR